ncbi:thermonuclease family protein [Muricoccus pecuniae]|uniref:Endonuclease YncB(Thermonuclease family) n=1 Tax=Muricoccus pecuniae TaxID=693023 RepID=A0A840YBY9_9PROT|nr:thermonuclease family protein [Roseomonas pecuniae]MBB5693591.1 endonuclease YncB(thermonuclease family) [Roseomonas pecuniae]
MEFTSQPSAFWLRIRVCLATIALLPVLACAPLSEPQAGSTALRGEVVAIHDGDTLTLLTPGNVQRRIRLAEIDAPESRQPFGTRARQALADLTFRRAARVDVVDVDRYGRTVGVVWVDGRNANAELVERGAAWVYRQYSQDPSMVVREESARRAKRGLWALPEAERVPPWEWRRQRRH